MTLHHWLSLMITAPTCAFSSLLLIYKQSWIVTAVLAVAQFTFCLSPAVRFRINVVAYVVSIFLSLIVKDVPQLLLTLIASILLLWIFVRVNQWHYYLWNMRHGEGIDYDLSQRQHLRRAAELFMRRNWAAFMFMQKPSLTADDAWAQTADLEAVQTPAPSRSLQGPTRENPAAASNQAVQDIINTAKTNEAKKSKWRFW